MNHFDLTLDYFSKYLISIIISILFKEISIYCLEYYANAIYNTESTLQTQYRTVIPMSAFLFSRHEKLSGSNSLFRYSLNCSVNTSSRFELAWHEEIEIKYILSGTMTMAVGTDLIHASQGDVVIINSCEYHANKMEAGEEAVYHCVCLNLSNFFNRRLMEAGIIPHQEDSVRFQSRISRDEKVRKYAEAFFDALPMGNEMLSSGLFIALLSTLLPYTMPNEILSSGNKRFSKDEIITCAIPYIHAHYTEQLKLDVIAGKCCVSKSHFSRIFKELTGVTPVFYANELKINAAISLMANANLAIKEIAAAVGFEDEAYFCRCFKKHTGFSPTAYLKAKL